MKASPRTNWLAVMTATLVGFGLLFAPREQTDRIETAINDAALPGLKGLGIAESYVVAAPKTLRSLTSDTAESDEAPPVDAANESSPLIDDLRQEVRQLQAQNAQLTQELEQARLASGSPYLAESAPPLFVPDLISARIIAADDVSLAVQRASAQRVVDIGQTDGIIPADFVVSSEDETSFSQRLLIDQGKDARLHADQTVFAGRCVVGKIQQVGRWTSTILPVTDAEYRGRAQLMRRTDGGLVVGAEGLLAGNGEDGCTLQFIAASEPVRVGDEVYTAVSGTSLPVPMYYGRVKSVALENGAPYWTVSVAPVETLEAIQEVQVLRVILNPSRTAASSQEVLP